jgi:hypothetical protein
MGDLTAKFTGLEEQLDTEHTATQASLDAINTRLDEFSTTLDTLLANNAVNTRALLAAIGQNSPCAPCPTPPIIIPPTGTTGLPIDSDACKRSQAFLNFMEGVFTVLDVASSVGIGFNPSLITDAFNQVIASLSGGDSPNAISFPEGVQLVGDMINYVALNLLRGSTLVGSFIPLYSDLRDAVYLSGSPDAAKTAYRNVIASSDLDSDIKTVLEDAAYNDLFSYFFDAGTSPDLTGLDGGVCSGSLHGITSCQTFSTVETSRGGHIYHSIQLPTSYGPDTQFIAGDFFGWTWNVVAGDAPHLMGMYYYDTGGTEHTGPSETVGDDILTIGVHTAAIGFFSIDFADTSGPFQIRFCPAE